MSDASDGELSRLHQPGWGVFNRGMDEPTRLFLYNSPEFTKLMDQKATILNEQTGAFGVHV